VFEREEGAEAEGEVWGGVVGEDTAELGDWVGVGHCCGGGWREVGEVEPRVNLIKLWKVSVAWRI